jgi:hypothetical protein
VNWPERVERVLVLATTAVMPVQNIAFQEVGRRRSWPIPTGRAAPITARAARPMRAGRGADGRAYHLSVRRDAVAEIRAAVAGP